MPPDGRGKNLEHIGGRVAPGVGCGGVRAAGGADDRSSTTVDMLGPRFLGAVDFSRSTGPRIARRLFTPAEPVFRYIATLKSACLAEFRDRYRRQRPHWALIPEDGGDPLTPEDVYVTGLAVQIPRWQGWATKAEEQLDQMILNEAA